MSHEDVAAFVAVVLFSAVLLIGWVMVTRSAF